MKTNYIPTIASSKILEKYDTALPKLLGIYICRLGLQ